MILVVGGAGYIGSHAVRALHERGEQVVVVDNLSRGHRRAVAAELPFYEVDMRDEKALVSVFEKHRIQSVIHFAASSMVGESMKNPLLYFDNNVAATVTLLSCMKKYEVKHIVFSSTAAVYGEPLSIPIQESEPLNPTNPYGESKRIMEQMFAWCSMAYDLKYVSLRYFNVAGAHPSGEIGEDHRPETHLIPLVLQVAQNKRNKLSIFGGDYPTKDGTNIRDYIHVVDLVQAHLLALDYLRSGGTSDIFNLGSGTGFSNLEIVEAAQRVTRCKIPYEMIKRRVGDPAVLIASSDKIKKVLGWAPEYGDMEKMLSDAWRWHQKNPNGYQ